MLNVLRSWAINMELGFMYVSSHINICLELIMIHFFYSIKLFSRELELTDVEIYIKSEYACAGMSVSFFTSIKYKCACVFFSEICEQKSC